MSHLKKLVIIIPCHNEEKGLGKVIEQIPSDLLKKSGYSVEVLVVNNVSSDKTEKIAQQYRCRIVNETKLGKGNAIKKGFENISKDTDIVAIIDGDNTYKSSEIHRIIEPIENGFSDVIVGSRLSGKTKRGSLSPHHRLANWFYTFIVRHFYRVNTTDVLSGFMAMRAKVAFELLPQIQSTGFSIEMELNIKASKMGYFIYSVPITYDIRSGESKIEGIKDAVKIFYTFYKYIFWKPKVKKIKKYQ